MRDFIVIVLVFALVIAGYFGYKRFFGEEAVPAVEAGEQLKTEVVAPAAEPKVEPAAQAPATNDPVATVEMRVKTGKSEDMAADMFFLARAYADRGDDNASMGYMMLIYRDYRESPYGHAAAAVMAEKKLAEGDMWEARNLYSFAYDSATSPEVRKKYVAKLDELNNSLIYSPADSKDSIVHQIKPGDYLSKLAAKYNCPYRLIMKINNISDPTKVRVGQRVKILTGPDGGPVDMTMLVDKSDFRLTVYFNGHYLKEYLVGIGKHDFTPVGEFTIGEKLKHPKYLQYEYGHPKNILGDYWMTLVNDRWPGLGVHGTSEPETIGTKSSAGCIRMYNKDVEELYNMIPRGTKVKIRE